MERLMHRLFPRLRRARPTRHRSHRPAPGRLVDRCLLAAGAGHIRNKLVSDPHQLARHTDRDLLDRWGFSANSNGPFRVSANRPGAATSRNTKCAKRGSEFIISPPAGNPKGTTSTPYRLIGNGNSSLVIRSHGRGTSATSSFSTQDGTIAVWNKMNAVIGADESGNWHFR
jgi:hypothetical protein